MPTCVALTWRRCKLDTGNSPVPGSSHAHRKPEAGIQCIRDRIATRPEEGLGAVGQKRVAQDYRCEQMLEQYRALYAETAQAHGLPDQTDSEELWLELGSN